MKFSFGEMFEDTEGGTSSKRVAFFIFIITFVALVIGCVIATWHFGVLPPAVIAFVNGTLDKITELIKWIGGFILADKAPSAVRAFTGAKKPDEPPAQ